MWSIWLLQSRQLHRASFAHHLKVHSDTLPWRPWLSPFELPSPSDRLQPVRPLTPDIDTGVFFHTTAARRTISRRGATWPCRWLWFCESPRRSDAATSHYPPFKDPLASPSWRSVWTFAELLSSRWRVGRNGGEKCFEFGQQNYYFFLSSRIQNVPGEISLPLWYPIW